MLAVAGVLTIGHYVVAAFAAPVVPAPVITGSPPGPTTSASATFTFTDSRSGVSFRCALDSASFASCVSGISYSQLAYGNHTFKVQAVSGSQTSTVTSYSWAVVPPAPVIVTHPANPTTATTASFTYTDTKSGVSFQCSLDESGFSACPASGISYSQLVDGNHTFRVRAMSGSQVSSVTSYSWAVVPPVPVIVTHPANPTTATTASFTYTDAQPDVSFQCSLDGSGFSICPRPGISYAHLASGSHTFMVEAEHGSGPPSSPASYTWQVGTAVNFTVGGNLTSPLYPGTSEPLNLTFTNPNSFPVTIASRAISASNITITTNRAGCSGSNFAVVQGLTVSVTIPARQLTAESLSALGVAQGNWPVIKMIETNTNQDACEGATLTLTYSGIEATG